MRDFRSPRSLRHATASQPASQPVSSASIRTRIRIALSPLSAAAAVAALVTSDEGALSPSRPNRGPLKTNGPAKTGRQAEPHNARGEEQRQQRRCRKWKRQGRRCCHCSWMLRSASRQHTAISCSSSNSSSIRPPHRRGQDRCRLHPLSRARDASHSSRHSPGVLRALQAICSCS